MFTEEVIKTGHIEGTLAVPKDDTSKRIVFILHGLGGHRDYCYQKQLGQTLPEKLGLTTFRYDSRNCGNSDPTDDPKRGRQVGGSDIEDLNEVYNYFCRDRGYEFVTIVAHSRGASIAFLWALLHPEIFVPYIINCSGRFLVWQYGEKVERTNPEVHKQQGYYLTAKRYGKYEPQWISEEEITEFGSQYADRYGNINPNTQVLTIFGSEDQQVPVSDAARWANLFEGRHHLEIIMGANHNFYGPRAADDSKVTFAPQVTDIITNYLSVDNELQRFYKHTQYSGRISRWPKVKGVVNFRDAGGYEGKIRPGIVFRSGYVSGITEQGKQQLYDLGIRWVVDLRSDAEREEHAPPKIPGIEVLEIPVFARRDMSPQAIAERYSGMMGSTTSGFSSVYRQILSHGAPTVHKVLSLIRDHPNEGILLHCTAGKDRTGVIIAVLLLFMGVHPVTVARDYELTTIGLTSFKEKLLKNFEDSLQGEADVNRKQMEQVLSSKYASMQTTIRLLEAEFGGAEQYLLNQCGFSAGDLAIIRRNLSGRIESHL